MGILGWTGSCIYELLAVVCSQKEFLFFVNSFFLHNCFDRPFLKILKTLLNLSQKELYNQILFFCPILINSLQQRVSPWMIHHVPSNRRLYSRIRKRKYEGEASISNEGEFYGRGIVDTMYVIRKTITK